MEGNITERNIKNCMKAKINARKATSGYTF